jgi:hypothetical protein
MASGSAKMWIVTHNLAEDYGHSNDTCLEYFNDLTNVFELRAYCGQLERASTGTYHYQYVIYLKDKQRLTYLKKRMPRGHFEIAYDKKNAWLYCQKEDTRVHGPYKYGHFPFSTDAKTVIDWNDIWHLAKRGQMDEIEPRVRIQYYTTLRKIRDFEQKPSPPLATTRGVWIYGEPGSFKSRFVIYYSEVHRVEWTGCPQTVLYDKKIDKWWDLYDGRVNLDACIDEVHPKCSLTFFHQLKTWADFRPFIADVKGGSAYPNPQNLFVTANYTLADCVYSSTPNSDGINDQQLYLALRRRFIDINMSYKTGRLRHHVIKMELYTPYTTEFVNSVAFFDSPEYLRICGFWHAYSRFYRHLANTTTQFQIPRFLFTRFYDKAGSLSRISVSDLLNDARFEIDDEHAFFDRDNLEIVTYDGELRDDSPSTDEEDSINRTRLASDVSMFAADLNELLEHRGYR